MRTLATAVVTALLSAAVGTAPAFAGEDKRPCVTKNEWRQVKVGMKKAQVHALFDTPGRFADGHAGGYTRQYRPCNWDGGTDIRLFVGYNGANNRVAEKRLV